MSQSRRVCVFSACEIRPVEATCDPSAEDNSLSIFVNLELHRHTHKHRHSDVPIHTQALQ